MAEDLKLIGLHEEAAAYEQQAETSFGLWAEHKTIYQVFQACDTNWRTISISSMAGAVVHYQGLERTSLESTLRMLGIKRKQWPQILAGIRIMERAALGVLNE